MRKLACTGCGAPLEWDGVTPVVTCSSCGSRFQMNTSGSRGNWQAAALRGDCVAERPGLERGSTDYGKSYYRCWLPKGWTYRIGTAPLDRAGSAATPFVPTIVLISPDKSANIIHTTTNAFQDPGPLGPMGPFSSMFGGRSGSLGNFGGNGTVGLDGLVHYPNCTLDPQTYTRMRPLITAAQDCDEIAQLNHPGCVFVNEQQPDDVARKRHEQVVADTPEQLRASLWSDWAGRLYRYQDDKGRPCLSLVEVEITTNGFNRQSPEGYGQQAAQAQRTGFFGRMANAMAQNMAQASTPRIWQIDYEMSVSAPESEFREVFEQYKKMRETIELGRDFAEMRSFVGDLMMRSAMQAQQVTQNAMMNMAAERAASWDRRAATIADTNAYTTSVMREMNANTSATNDRVAAMHSEMIREVNSYSGFGGTPVEADIRYDHVYGYSPVGGAPYEDAYLGVEGDWLQPGVDFVELPRKR